MAQQPPVCRGLLIIEASLSHSDTPHSVGLLWTSDQPDAETSIWQHTARTKDREPCSRRDSNTQPKERERPQTHALDRAATGIGPRVSRKAGFNFVKAHECKQPAESETSSNSLNHEFTPGGWWDAVTLSQPPHPASCFYSTQSKDVARARLTNNKHSYLKITKQRKILPKPEARIPCFSL
jgi:hypothetical protein